MAKLLETGHTTLVANNTASISSARYFADAEPIFAFPRYGNQCKAYITGREYMAAVAEALRGANQFIFIADWQLDYDVELDQRGTDGHKGRLTEILAELLKKKNVHVRVMLYDSVDIASRLGSPDTHEEKAQKILKSLDVGKGSVDVMLQNPNTGRFVNPAFSHHQKFIVIDGKIAFLGGIDLAYGRWETPNFEVVIDPSIHVLNDAYNQQLMPGRFMTTDEEKLTKSQNDFPGFRPAIGNRVLAHGFQPRQPWEDVSIRIEGPAAFDVFKNFVRRWNSFAGVDTNENDKPLSATWFNEIGGAKTLADPLAKGNGGQVVQICRSVSSKQGRDEFAALEIAARMHRPVPAIDTFDDWKTRDANNRAIWKAALARAGGKDTNGILQAMCNSIMAAESFIYIENQFFITECGKDRFGETGPASNPIGHTIALKIAQAIHAGQPFHVYLVIPEHPEGKLGDAGIKSQAYWAQQAIKHGTESLIIRIQRALMEAKLHTHLTPATAADAISKDPLTAGRWTEYLTVMHMRNFGATKHFNSSGQLIGEYLLTEMIYVHAKLLIVDDAVAIIGSANINDRSLLGNGDTEIAAVVVDGSTHIEDMGQGIRAMTRSFARNLRMDLWKKHLGMSIEGTPHGVEKRSAPPYGIDLKRPLAKTTIDGIKRIASDNAKAYETVFTHTLRNATPTLEKLESFFPNGIDREPPMLQSAYMERLSDADAQRRAQNAHYDARGTTAYHQHQQGNQQVLANEIAVQDTFFRDKEYSVHNVKKGLSFLKQNVKGYWTLAPLDWGDDYKKAPPPPAGKYMIAENERQTEEREG
jgi:phospholipase D1/2